MSLKIHELDSNINVPPNCHAVPIPNAYMTDEVYSGFVPKLCKDIREITVVRDHKYWWCVWSLGVFGSHANVHIAQEIFREHKIIIVEEEGDVTRGAHKGNTKLS